MTISFDLDNTLIPYADEFEVEPVPAFLGYLGVEALRKGTFELFTALLAAHHDIWIYTTSYRSNFKCYLTFRYLGILPTKFINGTINTKMLRKNNCSASKNPKLFGIDLHIDDAEGVAIEGGRYGFETLIIDLDDQDWVNTVLRKVSKIA